MPELWQAVTDSNAGLSTQLAILTAMVTGHRIGVVVQAKWEHIDFETGTWTIPARQNKQERCRMKSGREYALRLPGGLLARLKFVNERNEYIFESPTTKGDVSANALLRMLKRFDPNLTNHDFRNAIKEFCRKAEPPVPRPHGRCNKTKATPTVKPCPYSTRTQERLRFLHVMVLFHRSHPWLGSPGPRHVLSAARLDRHGHMACRGSCGSLCQSGLRSRAFCLCGCA